MDLQLPVQSVPITTKVVGFNPTHGEMYSIQHNVIKFVSNLQQVSDFFWVLPVFSTNKTDCHNITDILLKVVLSTITLKGTQKGEILNNLLFFSSPCQRQCELLPSLGIRRPLTFHILIFSETAKPIDLKLGRKHLLLISSRSINKHGRHRQFLFLIGWFLKKSSPLLKEK
jgi:hypothetical protein